MKNTYPCALRKARFLSRHSYQTNHLNQSLLVLTMKITILLVLFCASGSLGIKCRVCGTLGICSGPGDNGITKDCVGESNACYFAKSSKFSHFFKKLRLI